MGHQSVPTGRKKLYLTGLSAIGLDRPFMLLAGRLCPYLIGLTPDLWVVPDLQSPSASRGTEAENALAAFTAYLSLTLPTIFGRINIERDGNWR
jgi:hypothetical protein